MSIKVALIGANGQLGSDIVKHFSQGDLYDLTPLTRAEVDITHPDSVNKALRSQNFDVVINSAAYVRVDDCEDNVQTAFEVNAIGALNVARACRDIDALCVYISTDYVFRGDRSHHQQNDQQSNNYGSSYTEDDIPNPINIYGTSKLTGEYLVKQTTERSLILRISSVFGKAGSRGKGGNFVETIISKAKSGATLRVVNDMFMSPTYTHDAAQLLDALLQVGQTGIIHGSNQGSCSWYEFANTAFKLANIDHPIEPVTSSEFPTKASRPMNSALSSIHLPLKGHSKIPLAIRSWQEALADYIQSRE